MRAKNEKQKTLSSYPARRFWPKRAYSRGVMMIELTMEHKQ